MTDEPLPGQSIISKLTFPALVFVTLVALLATWAVATPLFASPDEPAHLFKAYGTAHGEAIGSTVEGFGPTIRLFKVPASMGTPDLNCYFGNPDTPAACAEGSAGPAISTAAVLPPFWYAVVGGGARLIGASTSQRAYRMVNAVLCAAVFAAAFAFARSSRQRRLTPFLFVALTPITLFLAGSVQPNGFEIASFALLWVLSMYVDHPRAPTAFGGLLVGGFFGAVLLSRFGAMLWVVTVTAIVMILIGRAGLKRFINRRFLVSLVGATAAAVLALIAWSKYAGVSVNDKRAASDWTTGHVISYTVGALPDIARQVVGLLGWLDTRLPTPTYVLYAVFTIVLMLGVILSRNRRLILATAAGVVAFCVVPVVVNVISAPTAGLIWQGRYSVPLFLGLGELGMIGWRQYADTAGGERVIVPLRAIACICFAVAEIFAFWQSLRRFTVGAHGKIWLSRPLPWSPPMAPLTLIAANIVFVAALCAVVLAGTRKLAVATTPA